MNEQFIIDMLILNHVNYQKYGDKRFEQDFETWMIKLQQHMNFNTLEEACKYYIALGEKQAA